ncbi:MAG: aminoglycoside phosphotransferase family protein, partial [Kiritimatiellae bacterium]|nr:aminoglycoside phosphotransferase family protein [Kiritimatiellia bacterium]
VTIIPIGGGNINDTFLAIFRNAFSETQVILQRINDKVFPKPEMIMANMHLITRHAHRKLAKEILTSDRVWQLPKIIQTRDGKDFFRSPDDGSYWRVITKISSATTFPTTQGPEHAAECGAVLAHFHSLVADIRTSLLAEPIPGFHVTPGYLALYDKTLGDKSAKARLTTSVEARRLSQFIEARRDFAATLENALKRGELKLRVMHGDPKITNIMIDDYTGKGTAIIDLDTVGPGLIHYDFGDAIRSICNPAGEEEMNLNKVIFDMDLFEAFVRGYLDYGHGFLTDADREYLFDSIRLISFELGLRFFQDYLAGSVYFKTKSPTQNLNRARVQFRLCESIESRERMIRAALNK